MVSNLNEAIKFLNDMGIEFRHGTPEEAERLWSPFWTELENIRLAIPEGQWRPSSIHVLSYWELLDGFETDKKLDEVLTGPDEIALAFNDLPKDVFFIKTDQLLGKRFPPEDLYILDPHWTYAMTHESAYGPYLIRY